MAQKQDQQAEAQQTSTIESIQAQLNQAQENSKAQSMELEEYRQYLQQIQPVVQYVNQPGVREAIDQVRGGTAPAPAADPKLDKDLIDISADELDSYLAARESRFMQQVVQAQSTAERKLEQVTTAVQQQNVESRDATLVEKMKEANPEFTKADLIQARQRASAMSEVDRSLAMLQGMDYAPSAGATPIPKNTQPNLPGGTGPAPATGNTTESPADAAKRAFLTNPDAEKQDRLAELFGH